MTQEHPDAAHRSLARAGHRLVPVSHSRERKLLKPWKDVLAVLGLLLIGWVILALCEATGVIHTLSMGGH